MTARPMIDAARHPDARHSALTATVIEVLPRVGLVHLRADDGSEWTVTRSTPGPGLDGLEPGIELEIEVAAHRGARLAVGYRRALAAVA